MTGQPGGPGLREGAELRPRRKTYGTVELFLFSAAGWHPHRIHYDGLYTTQVEGHAGVLVQGPLQAVHLVGALLEEFGPGVTLRSVRYRHLAPLLAGEETEMRGRVSASGPGPSATIELWMEKADGGQRTTVVTAVVDVVPSGRDDAR